MSWGEPQWLLVGAAALAALPVAVLVGRWRRLQLLRLATPRLWSLWLGGTPATGTARTALWLSAAALAALAAARPQWGRTGVVVASPKVAIALDVSASMAATDVSPSRLSRAASVLRSTVGLLRAADWSLTAGAGGALTVVPLSDDRTVLETGLANPALSRGFPAGSNLAALLDTAAGSLPLEGPGRVLIVATDGEQTTGDAAEAGRELRGRGLAVVALAAGTPAGAPVPGAPAAGPASYLRDKAGALVFSRAHPELLQALVGDGGAVVDAADPAAPQRLASLVSMAARRSGRTARAEHVAPWLLAAALVATGSFLLWPWRRIVPPVLVLAALPALALAPAPALAAGHDEVPRPPAWQRLLPGSRLLLADRGARALERGDFAAARLAYAEALALAPADRTARLGWATAAAMLGQREGEQALAELSAEAGTSFVASYNLGTARLARGDVEGALAALRRAVSLRPTSGEAWRNLELACRLGQRAAPEDADLGAAAAPADEQLVRAAAREALAAPSLPAPPLADTSEPTW